MSRDEPDSVERSLMRIRVLIEQALDERSEERVVTMDMDAAELRREHRREAAMAAMTGLLAGRAHDFLTYDSGLVANRAIEFADALLDRLAADR
jgi:hypothetical protein